jgi:YesN/AraC family two-component response regulator
MPRMNGFQLREKALALFPDTKFLLMSGYAEDAVTNPDSLGEGDFLEKPFLPDELLSKVRHLLDTSPSAELKINYRRDILPEVGT